MTYEEITSLLGFFCVLLGAAIGFSGYLKSKRQEGQEEGSLQGILKVMQQQLEEIRLEHRLFRETLTELHARVATVEASDRSAHKRINRLE